MFLREIICYTFLYFSPQFIGMEVQLSKQLYFYYMHTFLYYISSTETCASRCPRTTTPISPGTGHAGWAD